jgi:hypothetical protein
MNDLIRDSQTDAHATYSDATVAASSMFETDAMTEGGQEAESHHLMTGVCVTSRICVTLPLHDRDATLACRANVPK